MSKSYNYSSVFFSLTIGLFIYLVWRDTSSPVYHYVIQLGWSEEVNTLRNALSFINMPEWFVYSLPDGLWMFAFVLFMMSVWDFQFYGSGRIWIIASVIAGMSFEISQALISGIGVFDWADMICMATGGVLPVLLFKKNQEYETVY